MRGRNKFGKFLFLDSEYNVVDNLSAKMNNLLKDRLGPLTTAILVSVFTSDYIIYHLCHFYTNGGPKNE